MATENKSLVKYYIFVTISMLFWGLSFIWSKVALEQYEPITIIFFRLIISALVLFLIMKVSRKVEKMEKEDRKWFLMLALAEPFFYFLGENYGLKYVSTAITSAIIATIPLVTPVVAFLFIREKVDKFTIVGIIISFAGIIYMLVNRDFSLNAQPNGILLLFLAVFSAVAYTFFIKKLAHKYKAITILFWQNIIGAMYFLPLFLVFDFPTMRHIVPSTETILAIMQLAIFASSLAFLLFIIVVAKLGMVRANIFTNLIPVFTAFFAYVLLDELITFQKVIGIFLVITGIVLSQVPGLIQTYLRKKQVRLSKKMEP